MSFGKREMVNTIFCNMIHIESVYKTFMDEIESIKKSCLDADTSIRLQKAIDYVNNEFGGPDDLEEVRKLLRRVC